MYPTLTLSRAGSSIALTTANGYSVLPGVEGFDTPPVALSETEPADFDGTVVTNVRYQPREIFIPLLVEGANASEVRQRTRALAGLLNPQGGMTTLTVTHPPSTSAELLSASAVDGVSTSFDAVVGSVSTETTVVRTGSNSLKISSGIPASRARLKAAERTVAKDQATYKASAWVRAEATSTSKTLVGLEFYDAGGTLLSTAWSDYQAANTTTWANVSVDAVVPASAAKVGLTVWSAVNAYWDDLSLRELSSAREIDGYLSEPLGASLDATESAGWRRLGVTLRCPDPLWFGPLDGASLLSPSGDASSFSPLPTTAIPVRLSGDAAAWPTVQVATGSDTDYVTVVALLPTSSTDLDTALGAFGIMHVDQDVVTIETDPRKLSVALSDGTVAWSWLSTTVNSKPPSLFAIPPGEFYIYAFESQPPGLLEQATVSLTWRSRWLTAW